MRKYLVFMLLLSCALYFNASPLDQIAASQVSEDPGLREGPCMAYDTFNNVTMLFGGDESIDDTWFYDYITNTWSEHTGISPQGRINAGMVFCSESNEMIMYGGLGDTRTWSFSCETKTWSQVITANNPGTHQSHAMAYDSVENVVILFGGFTSPEMTTVDDMWMFDCETRDWTELHPSVVPIARYGHVMTYDASIDMIIMAFGLNYEAGFQNDTWTYDVSTNTWAEVDYVGTPGYLKWPAMVYNPIDEKNILFGGVTSHPTYQALDDTLVFDADTSTWTNREPAPAPGPRITPGMAFDSMQGVAVLHGGINMGGDIKFGDTWIYSYESNTWTDISLEPEPTTPPDQLMTIALVGAVGAAAIIVIIILRKRS